MFARSKVLFAAASILVAALSSKPASSAVLYNNLGEKTEASDSVFFFGPLANSFSTGSQSQNLKSVTVKLDAFAPDFELPLLAAFGAAPPSVQVDLLADNGSTPGMQLLALGSVFDTQLSVIPTDFTFTLATSFGLNANTRYWIGLSSQDGSSAAWDYTRGVGGTGVAGEYSASNFLGFQMVNQNNDDCSSFPYQMEVTTTLATVPLPASAPMFGAAILVLGAVGYSVNRKKVAAII